MLDISRMGAKYIDKFAKKIEKPWGYELIFAHTPKYAGKLIFVTGGHRLSLQYHKKKDETLYVYQGKAVIEIGEDEGRMVQLEVSKGDRVRIRPLTRHRFTAMEDTTVFEVSTPELDDVKRLADDYGRVSSEPR